MSGIIKGKGKILRRVCLIFFCPRVHAAENVDAIHFYGLVSLLQLSIVCAFFSEVKEMKRKLCIGM